MRCPSLADLSAPPEKKTGWPWTAESPQLGYEMPSYGPWPRVSIIMPSYNQAQFIEEAIRSVLLQGYPDIEFIIMDGGSSDGSLEIIKRYSSWISFWVSEPDRGQSHAVNKAISRATGQILHWINSDDMLLPSALSRVARSFIENRNFRLITGQAKYMNASGKVFSDLNSSFSSWEDFVTRRCNIAQVATFFDRRLFDELGMIDESLDYCMDADLLLRFTKKYSPLIVEFFVTAYRSHAETKFDHNRIAGFVEADQTYLKHLKGTSLEPGYRQWSSSHWLSLSSFENLSVHEKAQALIQAARMNPAVIFSHSFYLSILRAGRIAFNEYGKHGLKTG